jgi:hypothetical protein
MADVWAARKEQPTHLPPQLPLYPYIWKPLGHIEVNPLSATVSLEQQVMVWFNISITEMVKFNLDRKG